MQNIAVKEQKPKTKDQITVALAGNPNAGKTTLFNALTGLRQKVANYPGVTVERKEGVWRIADDKTATLIDLPGLYSLDANSIDEQIARDVLTGKIAGVNLPDVIIAVVDATNLERNLYLVTQLLEYRIPLVVALTMIDETEKSETIINAEILSEELGVPVVQIIAAQKRGIEELQAAIFQVLENKTSPASLPFFKQNGNGNSNIIQRYAWISRVVSDAVEEKQIFETTVSEKIDRILTHRVFGLAILTAILLLIFQTIFSWATLPMDLLDAGFGALGEAAKNNLPPGLFTDLLTDGIIAGVGGVLVFLPQIILLFFFISILEDTGYMARAAFLMDRLMRGVGLHGKAFVPLLSSFACAIPGIMATRTIENPKDRLATILIAPLMSCSARLPVYTLMIAAFFSGQYVFGFLSLGAVLILAMYLLGIVTAIVIAFVLKRTVLKAPAPPLVMELPRYRLPNWKNVFLNVFQRAGMFVKRAGTVILAISIILWALTTFPRTQNPQPEIQNQNTEIAANDEQRSANEAAEQLKNSFAGRIGHAIEPVIAPLGFDWKMGVALISSFAAREVLVSTLSIIYNVGKDADAESDSLISAVREAKKDDGTPAWTPLTALTMMVFFVLAMQCMSTIAVVRRETNSWSWTLFMIGYMTALAYAASFLTFQIGKLLGF
ncbi:MAG TPA: ferrous iron transport protein B [Pyrinomonadaceae bacterium]